MQQPMPEITWLETLQELLRHYWPPVENTPTVNVASLTLVVAGLFLAFRSWKFERFVISLVGLIIGSALGYSLAAFIGTPEPITAALGAVLLTVLAYHTYRWWLACGSVVILFCAALVFQLGRGDLQRFLPVAGEGGSSISGDQISSLPTPTEMARNLHPSWSEELAKVKEPIARELKALGPVGWLVPVAAAILGGLLAYWALRAFAVIWLGFLGAAMVILGVSMFICAHWPDVRTSLITEPRYAAGAAIGLWLLGLIWQAKEARIPKKAKTAGPPAKDAPKS